jgi:hypothetical protein
MSYLGSFFILSKVGPFQTLLKCVQEGQEAGQLVQGV